MACILSIEINDTNSTKEFPTPGVRFNHILDRVGFPSGHGRVKELQLFLSKCETFGLKDIKYGSVRAWFHDNAPPMRKIQTVLKALVSHYDGELDIEAAAVWWKMGGVYPFESGVKKHSLDLVVSSLVMTVLNNNPSAIEEDKLEQIKSEVTELCELFADPNQRVCPEKYIKMLIENRLRESSSRANEE